MKALITGVAGFIGSHLAEHLISSGDELIGIDAFTEYYDRGAKWRNLSLLTASRQFRLIEGDLLRLELSPLLAGVDVVFHLAGQPGVRSSWGDDFRVYVDRNILATQRLLEALTTNPVKSLVFASSSSVYGNARSYPVTERRLPRPASPYGVTKLAAERLCLAYAETRGIPSVALRYFTVYGPRQRPDMAFSRFIESLANGKEVTVYGDGSQTREFTYVADAVEATVRAASLSNTPQVFNVGGGARATLRDALVQISCLLDVPLKIRRAPWQPGDVRHTGADLRRASEMLGYVPRTELHVGLKAQIDWWQAADRGAATAEPAGQHEPTG